MAKHTVYGLGGYDPTAPNNNVVEEVETDDPPTDDTPTVTEVDEALSTVAAEVVE